MKLIRNSEGNFKISDTETFLLKLPNPNSIYIKESEIKKIKKSNPDFFNFLEQQRTSKRLSEDSIYYDYEKFTIKKDYEIKGEKNDCLLFAEKVSLSNPTYNKSKSVFKVESDKTNRRFGVSDSQNIKIANYIRNEYLKKNPSYNVEINPNINDAYAVVPHDLPIDSGMCPYHVATVIFKDGNTNITIEADAGIKTNTGIFDMYSVTESEYSFFSSHKNTYMQYSIDASRRIKFKLPIGLWLKKDFDEDVETPVSSTPLRRSARLAKGKKNTRKKENRFIIQNKSSKIKY